MNVKNNITEIVKHRDTETEITLKHKHTHTTDSSIFLCAAPSLTLSLFSSIIQLVSNGPPVYVIQLIQRYMGHYNLGQKTVLS